MASENAAVDALSSLPSLCNGETHLYKAIAISVLQFITRAHKNRPWVLVILTDGRDNESGSADAKETAQKVLTAFNKPASNFTFLIGLGKDVNTSELERLSQATHSCYMPAQDSSALMLLFAIIATQVTNGVEVNLSRLQAEGAEVVLAQVSRVRKMSRQAIDLLLLVDISGSMRFP
jgi:Mg-chelatase subunit ChlD